MLAGTHPSIYRSIAVERCLVGIGGTLRIRPLLLEAPHDQATSILFTPSRTKYTKIDSPLLSGLAMSWRLLIVAHDSCNWWRAVACVFHENQKSWENTQLHNPKKEKNMINTDLLKTSVVAWNEERKQKITEDLQDYLNPNLKFAMLKGCDLKKAFLFGARLSTADLSRTDLEGSDIRQSNIAGSSFAWANLTDCDLSKSEIWGSSFYKATMIGCDFSDIRLSRGSLNKASFQSADLFGSSIEECDLSYASLNHANLERTIFSNMKMVGTDMRHATMSGTIFCNVDLRRVRGLDTVQHNGPSEITLSTLEKSDWQIPEYFLRGCGVSEEIIKYINLIVRKNQPKTLVSPAWFDTEDSPLRASWNRSKGNMGHQHCAPIPFWRNWTTLPSKNFRKPDLFRRTDSLQI